MIKKNYFLLILTILMIICNNACGQSGNGKYYPNTDDQFTFIVFDAKKIEEFKTKFKPLNSENIELKNAIKNLSLVKYQSFNNDKKYNTNALEESDYDLAKTVINAALNENNPEYYSGSIDYLFYYYCLPEEFQSKWVQTQLGHFEFNITFLSLLRKKSKEYDDILYGNSGFWDDDLKFSFGEFIYNEITPETAQKIKNTIEADQVFDDKRFKNDKEIFLDFLTKTIRKEYRLFLIDWD